MRYDLRPAFTDCLPFRFKNRYFLCELILGEKSTVDQSLQSCVSLRTALLTRVLSAHIQKALKEAVQDNFGDFGLGSGATR